MPPRGRTPAPVVVLVVGLVVGLAAALAACGVLGGPASAPAVSGVPAWQAGPAAPVALTEVAAAAHDGRIWIAGGLDAGGAAVTDVAVLDPATERWDPGPRLPAPIHHSALASTPAGLLLLGGYRADGQPTGDVLRLDAAADAWVPGPPLPEPRGAGGVTGTAEGAVYAGGVGPGGVQVELLRLQNGTWNVAGRLPIGREHVAATADPAGRVFVLGGRRGGLDSNESVVDVLEGETVRTIGRVPTARGGVAAFWWPSLGACLVGGESPAGTNPQVECIDREGTVRGLPDLARPRHGIGAAVVEGRAYVLLGGEQPGLFVSDAVEVLELP